MPTLQKDDEACVRFVTSGPSLPKTSNADMIAKAYNLQIKQQLGQIVPKLLYLYQVAVRNLRSHFSKVRFFSCSAIGIGNNSVTASSFKGLRILDPMLWLLRQV